MKLISVKTGASQAGWC